MTPGSSGVVSLAGVSVRDENVADLARLLLDARLRLRATFTCEGRLFKEGASVMLEDPLVQRIAAEYPGVFERAPLISPS